MINIINKVKNTFKSLEEQTIYIIKNGLKFCSLICLVSIITLLIYDFINSNPYIYYIGLTLFKMSSLFSIEFLICGIVVDGLKKKLI